MIQVPEPSGAMYGSTAPTRPAGDGYAVGMHEHAREFHAATQSGDTQPSAPMYTPQQGFQGAMYPEIRH